ncbi:MAG: BCCT family transporter [Myxococcota bacterium]|nr:BCCT family transporter [Myxococcota bacterium]MEE2673744.1 BCCT family transporter [Myxococcota bacterium]
MPSPQRSMPDRVLARIGLPSTSSRVAVATVAAFVVGSAVSIEAASAILVAARDWVIHYFGWLFVLVATLAVVVVAGLAIHPRAGERLGPAGSRPEFGNLAWFAMLFSAGLASGVLYWATAEPITHQQGNPFIGGYGGEGGRAAVTTAMRLTVLHWGLHGWAFYVLAGLGIAIYSYRHGRPLTFRSAFYPLLGPKYIDRWPGLAVDLIAVFGTVCGVSTSIGLSAAAMNATLGSLFQIDVDISNQIVIVFAVCLLGTLSAVSGLARGIRRLSEANVWLSALLLIAFAVVGPTTFLAGLFVETLIDYVVHVLPTGMWLAETPEHEEWQAAWTLFYWGWWLAWTPFVGLFIARISRGRTVREFCVAVMLVPTLVTIVWMSVFGGTALYQEIASPGSVSAAVNQDYSLGIATVIDNLGRPTIGVLLTGTAALLLLTWLITSLDSATLVMCHLLGTDEAAPAKVFWGVALAMTTTVLLLAGGLPALQAASIVIGLPLALLMVLLIGGILRDLAKRRL